MTTPVDELCDGPWDPLVDGPEPDDTDYDGALDDIAYERWRERDLS